MSEKAPDTLCCMKWEFEDAWEGYPNGIPLHNDAVVYVRHDLYEEVKKERDELREKLADTRASLNAVIEIRNPELNPSGVDVLLAKLGKERDELIVDLERLVQERNALRDELSLARLGYGPEMLRMQIAEKRLLEERNELREKLEEWAHRKAERPK